MSAELIGLKKKIASLSDQVAALQTAKEAQQGVSLSAFEDHAKRLGQLEPNLLELARSVKELIVKVSANFDRVHDQFNEVGSRLTALEEATKKAD